MSESTVPAEPVSGLTDEEIAAVRAADEAHRKSLEPALEPQSES